MRALIENYRVWRASWIPPIDRSRRSTTLFDTVAVHMAFSEELLKLKELPIKVTDEGMTVVDAARRPIRCAVDWHDLAAFEDLLVQRITS